MAAEAQVLQVSNMLGKLADSTTDILRLVPDGCVRRWSSA